MEETIQPLSRIFLEIGPLKIYWYGALIGIGVAIGYIMATRETIKRGLPKDTFADLLLWALPISIICARLYYVAFRFEHYVDDPIRVLYIWEGGLAIHGGLIGGVATAIVYAKKQNIPIFKLLDIGAPSILLAQAIGRWGNFMNQEVYGGPVTREFLENLLLPNFIINQMYINGTYYQPTFLYESIWNMIGVVILLYLRRLNLKQGEIFYSYLIWYSIGRFVIEGMRLDNLMIGDTLRTAQVASIILIIGAVITWIYRRRAGLANQGYLDEIVKQQRNNKAKKRKKK
ncbi:prolipoprotein diacylglyceryl transferase [Alkalihalobacillus alcalophilus ATCC 27647 = CGMCC 1.3604]|uniref:Phosphatidylglycerol--prolipoprotein diacylglyceryl transferase n=1 Tax=Alkalihalobacillus alcalophilus ATCC 27647 = CGMCC 1.3604 TaxID=1218173 RepID=A0A094WIN7_ALKAL|nr:prolipoprotein diacylglyceryl transferase [Alkalihalobacillus alcalophilus]KGA95783.1 diacylglyceryl transferase [Alkalihalobacillus alcalophilus ATCC 27647 = CGMCC 1.3604]MED1564175.1 prolipoprotein diacylglyceryl transferase [Alkalihalobacillus alcalophilus]THG88899.1 prolipoprotein diacylglyceryl transferase [Alkalihalobacillus alcalophilus ATCC 27647 = CGMCC 1.3604]